MSRYGRGSAVFVVTSTGSINVTVLGTVSFPTCVASGVFVVVLVVAVVATTNVAAVVVSKMVVLLGGCASVVRDILGTGNFSFFQVVVSWEIRLC